MRERSSMAGNKDDQELVMTLDVATRSVLTLPWKGRVGAPLGAPGLGDRTARAGFGIYRTPLGVP